MTVPAITTKAAKGKNAAGTVKEFRRSRVASRAMDGEGKWMSQDDEFRFIEGGLRYGPGCKAAAER